MPMTLDEAYKIVVTYGKHKGKTLADIVDQDPSYIDLMMDHANNPPRFKQAVELVRNANSRVIDDE